LTLEVTLLRKERDRGRSEHSPDVRRAGVGRDESARLRNSILPRLERVEARDGRTAFALDGIGKVRFVGRRDRRHRKARAKVA